MKGRRVKMLAVGDISTFSDSGQISDFRFQISDSKFQIFQISIFDVNFLSLFNASSTARDPSSDVESILLK
jgi:hypothetical protein